MNGIIFSNFLFYKNSIIVWNCLLYCKTPENNFYNIADNILNTISSKLL